MGYYYGSRSAMQPFRPAHTAYAALTSGMNHDALITLASVKDYLGVIDFDGDDTLIGRFILQGIRKTESIIGKIQVARPVTDYYKSFSDRMELSHTPPQSGVAMKYLDETGKEQTVQTTRYIVDSTSDKTAIVFAESVNDFSLSDKHANPVSAVYSPVVDDRPLEAVRTAIKYLTNDLYYNRGDVIQRSDDHHVFRELQSYRRLIG